ncbi:transporter substrate-binding domain-containing protein [Myxococcota bacterium]|nr:transporter substrate-binding domain-containing protein [Myxococcota bacterium]
MNRFPFPVTWWVLLGLFAALLSGCQGPSSRFLTQAGQPSPGRLPEILDRGELLVAVSGDLPPLNMKNKTGEIIGLEIDLIQSLADAMGIEVRFIQTPFPKLISSVQEGSADLAISGITMTPQRNERVPFVGPYFISGASLLTKNHDLAEHQDIEHLDRPDRRYAALANSTSSQFVKNFLSQATLVSTENYEDAVAMVIAGQVDGLIADFHICMLATWRHPDAQLVASRTPLTVEPLGIALPPNAPLFLNLVSNYLNTLEDTGLLTQMKARWLSDGSWLSELP